MELAFESESLRTLCESETDAKRELGPAVAEILRHRLADLRAAASVNDLLAGRPRFTDDADQEYIIVDLYDGYRLVLAANHPKNPLTETGRLDWTRVSRIKVLWIESDDD